MDKRTVANNEFSLLRSVLRSKGALDLEVENHLKRMETKVKSLVTND
jgi:hypothetical protein